MYSQDEKDYRIVVALLLAGLLFIISPGGKEERSHQGQAHQSLFFKKGALVLGDPLSSTDGFSFPPNTGPLLFEKIMVNRADEALLQTVPGIGATLAERLVAEREANGPYQQAADLERVSGIGRVRSEILMNHLRFD